MMSNKRELLKKLITGEINKDQAFPLYLGRFIGIKQPKRVLIDGKEHKLVKDDPNTQTGPAKIGFFDSDEGGNVYDHKTGKLKFKVLEYYD